MVCGGTGITPMYQIIQNVLGDASDLTRLQLIYNNVDTNSMGPLTDMLVFHVDRQKKMHQKQEQTVQKI